MNYFGIALISFSLRWWTENNIYILQYCTRVDMHYSDIHAASTRPCSRRYSVPEFSRHANPTAQHTQLTNDYKNMITVFGFPTVMPLGQWSQLGGSLVMFLFQLASSLRADYKVCCPLQMFFFLRGKQSNPPTDYFGLHTTAEQHKDITHLCMSCYTAM